MKLQFKRRTEYNATSMAEYETSLAYGSIKLNSSNKISEILKCFIYSYPIIIFNNLMIKTKDYYNSLISSHPVSFLPCVCLSYANDAVVYFMKNINRKLKHHF